MSSELQRIAADILIAKIEKDTKYETAESIASDYQTIYNKIASSDILAMHFMDKETLNKPEELDEKEFEEIKKHTILGFQHLVRQCFMKGLVTIVAIQHHERFDGSGYPKGLAGDKIHEYARIVAIADLFDAYTSDRAYRRLHSIAEALDLIRTESGGGFDPRIVNHFLSVFE